MWLSQPCIATTESKKDRGQVLRVRSEGRIQLRRQLSDQGVNSTIIHRRIVDYNLATRDLLLNDLYLYAKNCLKGEYLEVFLKRARDCLLGSYTCSDSEPDDESECEPASSSKPNN